MSVKQIIYWMIEVDGKDFELVTERIDYSEQTVRRWLREYMQDMGLLD